MSPTGVGGVARRAREWVRWRRILASCRYDPHRDGTVEELRDGDFVIAGCPRSGTSLLAAQLFRPPRVVTVMEPWDGLRMPPADLMRSLRDELAAGRLSRGRLDVGELRSAGRVGWVRDGEREFPVEVEPGFQLGVKWPAFWHYLQILEQSRFLVCVRHPVEVVASFAHTGGRLGEGFDYDVAINRAMNAELRASTDDPATRRALLWEYIHSRIIDRLDRPNVMVVRYERWFEDPDRLLAQIAAFLGVDLDGSMVDIQEPTTRVDAHTKDLVAEHCPTAAALGYEV